MFGWLKNVGKYFGVSPKGKDMTAGESATEDSVQAALDKLVTGPKAFGNRTMSASDAEKQLTAQGVLPPGWRLRESDSTSSGYRPTNASTKTMGAIRVGQIAAAVGTGGLSLPAQAAISGGLGAAGGAMGGGGFKGALVGGALGAAGPYVPGGATASLGRKVATQAGMGAGGALAQGGDWKDALIGGGFGAASAGAGKFTPKVGNALGQKAINFGINTGLDSARTGKFNPYQAALGAGGTFLPDAARAATPTGLGQRAINFGGNLALNRARGGDFNPLDVGFGALNVANPKLASRIQSNPGMRAFEQFQQFLPHRQHGGPVKKDEPAVVGEDGPEILVPKKDGTVVANPNTAPTTAPTDDSVAPQGNFWDTYGKPIATGGGIAAGMYFGKRAQDAAAQRSPEELAAIQGATGPGGAGDIGRSLMSESRPYVSKPASYYQTLLNGNRAAMAQAVAPQRAALNESFRGAQAGLAHSNVRGAARDQLAGNLNRERATQVAGLTTGVQPAAAQALAGLGQDLQKNAVPLLNSANNFYGQLLQSGVENRKFAAGEGDKTASSIGKLVADLGTTKFGKGKAPAKPGSGSLPTPPPTPPQFDIPESLRPPAEGNVDYGENDFDYNPAPTPVAAPDYGATADGSNPWDPQD